MLILALLLAQATQFLPPISYRQVTVSPNVKPSAPRADALSLQQGLAAKVVTVREHGDVNSVVVQNHGDKALLLVGGEMILGGQQDRIIGHDQVLQPHQTATVAVFCVEHGRWSGAQHFGSAGGIVDAKVRAKGDQQAVWDEVARKTARLKAETPTGTYRQIGETTQEATKPYRQSIGKELAKLKDVVGMAAVVNGRIVSVDVFGAPELFAQYRDRLLDSAVVSAMESPEAKEAPAPAPAEVEKFINAAKASVVRSSSGAVLRESAVSDQ
jgi:hypothetical protein